MTEENQIFDNSVASGASKLVSVIRFGLIDNQPKGPHKGERLKTHERHTTGKPSRASKGTCGIALKIQAFAHPASFRKGFLRTQIRQVS